MDRLARKQEAKNKSVIGIAEKRLTASSPRNIY